jgi:hypothetical protein
MYHPIQFQPQIRKSPLTLGIGSGLIVVPITVVIASPFVGLTQGALYGLALWIIVFIVWGLVVGFVSGMAPVQHFTLRLILHEKGFIPWNYARFLDWACDRLFLQRVGGGYIFVHRLLLEHFAQMEISVKKTLQDD